MRLAEWQTDVAILTCAVSAGIHAALAPAHFEEGAAAGTGFAVASVALALLAVALTRRPSQPLLVATVLVFGGLIASYAAAVTTGVPVLHPETEPVDGLALFTKGVELLGLIAAAGLVRRPSFLTLEPKGSLT